jgi:cytochrome b561
VDLFRVVRLLSGFESVLFIALLVVWLGRIDEQAEFVLGLSHGIGVIVLCLLIWVGCLRRVFPWPLLAAAVSPLGPVAAAVGIEILRRRRVAPETARG